MNNKEFAIEIENYIKRSNRPVSKNELEKELHANTRQVSDAIKYRRLEVRKGTLPFTGYFFIANNKGMVLFEETTSEKELVDFYNAKQATVESIIHSTIEPTRRELIRRGFDVCAIDEKRNKEKPPFTVDSEVLNEEIFTCW